ncbi:IS110 family transposase, partial [Streptomyces formicae]
MGIGKELHHCVVINAEGEWLLPAGSSTTRPSSWNCSARYWKCPTMLCGPSTSTTVGAALLLGLLVVHRQPVAYLTGLSAHRALVAYRGEGKTDARLRHRRSSPRPSRPGVAQVRGRDRRRPTGP